MPSDWFSLPAAIMSHETHEMTVLGIHLCSLSQLMLNQQTITVANIPGPFMQS